MKRKLHFKSLLLLAVMLLGAGSAWAADKWVKTDFANLETGDIVVIADKNTASTKAMPNDGGTGSAPSLVNISFNDDQTEIISKVDAKIQWVVNKTDDGLQFGVAGTETYLYCTNNNNGVRVGTNKNNIFTIKENFLFNNEQSRYLGVYNQQDWRCYTTIHNNIKTTEIAFYKKTADSSDKRTETTVTISGNSTEVSMGDAVTTPTATVKAGDATITTATVKWSSSDTEVASIDESTGAITLNKAGETTITASFEGNDSYKESEASYTLTVKVAAADIPTYTSIEDLQKDATETETPIKFTFNNIQVTAVKGKNAYITDGTYGALVYTDGHGLEAGDIINGTIETTLMLYKGQTEITGVKASDENLTITSGTVTPVEKSLDEITTANQSLLVTLKSLTYDKSAQTFSYGSNSIKYYKNFTDDPTLEDGKVYDVTGVIIVYNTTIEISPLNTDDVVEVVSAKQEIPGCAWVSGDEDVTSICVLAGESISAYFDTNSTGTKSFESSNTDVATVDGNGKITLTGTAGVAVITAATEENSDFFAGSATLAIIVASQEVEDGVFDFAIFNDYGSGIIPHNSNYNFDASTWTAGNVTMKVSGKYRWFLSTSNVGDFRLYSNTDPQTSFTITAPEGYYITSVSGVANTLKVNEGVIESNVWKGLANEVTFTYTANATIKKLVVVYSKPEVDVTIGDGYTSFCNSSNLDFSKTDVKVYTAKQSKGAVVLTEVENGIVPAGEGVILSGTAGTYTATVQATADKIEGNELKGVTEDTEVVYQQSKTMFNYILQGDVFKKATGDKLKAGRAYLHTQYDVTAAGARELKMVIEGEATGIKAVETADGQTVYDLLGRKVAAPTKGLYIVNGKKMIVK